MRGRFGAIALESCITNKMSIISSSVLSSGRDRLSGEKPIIQSVSIPEAKKRRHPTKHYVYKIVVQWSDGSSTTIYRRYSTFFDFQVKLQELFTSLKERLTSFQGDNCPTLPELPGKILFGRTQVHQVAEKRRVKIEEFCRALVNLPSEISHSHLVLSFFNTWAEDTLHHFSSHAIKDPSSPISMATCVSPTSPTSTTSIINHPDEMDKLEQYRVVVEYERKDNHQVNLLCGQIVHVIEKHYTGWWMVVTEEEQGYAPAAHLEAIDKTYDSLDPEDNTSQNEEFEVMDTYKTENDDELELFPGDKVVVLNKNMDGWWQIRNTYGVVGYCPATVLRKSVISSDQPQTGFSSYENEKDLYQELNIHKPPPRRSTLDRTSKMNVYKSPKHVKQWSNSSMDDPIAHYQVPRNNSSASGSDETSGHGIDLNNPPFSPNHYELGPSFTEESGDMNSSIYENTTFDEQQGADETTPISDSNPYYQNIEFQDQKSPSKSTSQAPDDEEYINPEEFIIDEAIIRGLSADIHQGAKSIPKVNYKKVTIADMPLTPPIKKPDSRINDILKKPAIRSALTHSKSLGDATDEVLPDDEYIDMDPVYAPVAPDEPLEDKQPEENQDKASLVQSVGAISGARKPKPAVPPFKPKPQSTSDKEDKVVPKGRVLERTKSLENLLSGDSVRGRNVQSPKPTNDEPGTPTIIKKHVDYDHLEVSQKQSASNPSSPNIGKKPDVGRKPPHHKTVLGHSPSSPGDFRKVNSPPTNDFTDGPAPPLPPPNFSPSHHSKGSFVPKTYLAIESYESQAPGCLSFNAGDKCSLIRQSNGGWWYVNIGGVEGWTPGDFWQENNRKPSNSMAPPPPSMAPKKPVSTKPRSQTQSASILDKPLDSEPRSSSVSGNGVKPLPGKIRGQPAPPKPRPLIPGQPMPKTVPSSSLNPPPLPPPRKGSAPNGGVVKDPVNDYTLLENASSPTLEEHLWFAGSMEREKAEQFLMDHGRQREFLVRERTNKKGYYALSIRYHYSVKHFNIDPQSNGSYSMGVMNFSSIPEVIKHYQLNSLFIHDGQPVALGQPARRKSKLNH